MFRDAPASLPLLPSQVSAVSSFDPTWQCSPQLAQLQLVAADMQSQAAMVRAEVEAAMQLAQWKQAQAQAEAQYLTPAAPSFRPPPGLASAPNGMAKPAAEEQFLANLSPAALLAAARALNEAQTSQQGALGAVPNAVPTPAQGKQGKPQKAAEVQPKWQDKSPAQAPSTTAGGVKGAAGHETMRSHLQALRNEDSRCIFIARRIGRLGFRSKDVLEKFFSRYGQVRQVLVAHSKVKPFGETSDNYQKKRPGNFGLVLMKNSQTVDKILQQGPTLTVSGVDIQVQPFFRVEKSPESDGEEATGEDDHLSAELLKGLPDNVVSDGATTGEGIPHPRQTSSSGSSDEVSTTTPNEALTSASDAGTSTTDGTAPKKAGAQRSVRFQKKEHVLSPPPQAAEADGQRDAKVAEVLQELSNLTKETAALAHWGQMKFRQLEEQCHQRIAQLDEVDYQGNAKPLALAQIQTLGALLQMPYMMPKNQQYPVNAAVSLQPTAPQAGPVQQAPVSQPARVAQGKQSAPAQTPAAPPMPSKWTGDVVATPPAKKDVPAKQTAKAQNNSKEKNGLSKMRMQMASFNESTPGVRDTLRAHLTQLGDEDEACIFIVRRINKLGFQSREVLHKHFSAYGEVVQVLVAHSRVRNVREMDGQVMVRPGGLGLVVMKEAQVVKNILENGEEQIVGGYSVRVQAFQRPKGALEPFLEEAAPASMNNASVASRSADDRELENARAEEGAGKATRGHATSK